MKWFVYTMAGLFALLVIAAAVVAFMLATFDPNEYKEKSSQIVQEKTGRTLTLEGPVELTYFPVLGFTVRQASLGNPPGFGGGEFAAIDELRAGVKILPLISGEIQLDSIHAIKPKINVIKQASGATNLEFKPEDTASREADKEEGENGFAVTTGKIEISDATVIYTDKGKEQTTTFDPVNFTLSSFAFNKSSSLSLDAVIKTGSAQIETDISADIVYDNEKLQLTVRDFSGEFNLANPDIAQNIKILASSAAVIADLKAQQAQLENAKLNWEDTAIKADGSLGWGAQKDARFTLSANMINIDQILNTLGAETDKSSAPKAQTAAKGQELPVDFLKNLSANGTINVETVKAFGLTLNKLDVKVNGNNGVLNFDPVKLSLYGGTALAEGQLDASGSTLRGSKQGRIENIQLGELLQDVMGEGYVSGTATGDYDLSFSGNTLQALISRLGGDVSFEVAEGSVNHWQLSQRINQAIAFFDTKQLNESASEDFRFTTLKGSFNGQSGVFRNNDFVLIGPKSHALGAGQINLVNKTVDYTLRVGLGDEPQDFDQADHLPVTMTGPFSAPRYGIDIQALIRERAGEKIEEKKQELLGKALDKLDLPNKEEEDTTTGDKFPARDALEKIFGN